MTGSGPSAVEPMLSFVSREQVIELVRRAEYEVDCRAVAEAILARIGLSTSQAVLVSGEGALGALEPDA